MAQAPAGTSQSLWKSQLGTATDGQQQGQRPMVVKVRGSQLALLLEWAQRPGWLHVEAVADAINAINKSWAFCPTLQLHPASQISNQTKNADLGFFAQLQWSRKRSQPCWVFLACGTFLSGQGRASWPKALPALAWQARLRKRKMPWAEGN